MLRPPPIPTWDTLHPLVVHFPIALLFIAPLFIVLALLWKRATGPLLIASWLLVAIGTIAAMVSVSTGEASASHAEQFVAAGPILDRHADLAESARNFFVVLLIVLTLGVGTVLVLRDRARRGFVIAGGLAYLIAHSAGCIILANAGHEGGRLVREGGMYGSRSNNSLRRDETRPGVHLPHTASFIAIPPSDATTAAELPALRNVVTFAPGIMSGAMPEGDEAFDTLAAMGVRTILSVDGAVPDVARAELRGLRYVHLPIGYHGFTPERALEMARVVRDLPRPVYIHCHHGKHRSAAAAASVCISLGLLDTDTARSRMRVSKTADHYKGLWKCVDESRLQSASAIDSADATFPSIRRPSRMVDAMVTIDAHMDTLAAAHDAGWTGEAMRGVPEAAAALADECRALEANSRVQAKGEDFIRMLRESQSAATRIEAALLAGAVGESAIAEEYHALQRSCKVCHEQHRD